MFIPAVPDLEKTADKVAEAARCSCIAATGLCRTILAESRARRWSPDPPNQSEGRKSVSLGNIEMDQYRGSAARWGRAYHLASLKLSASMSIKVHPSSLPKSSCPPSALQQNNLRLSPPHSFSISNYCQSLLKHTKYSFHNEVYNCCPCLHGRLR